MWFNPYVDSYDRRGELWHTQIYLLTYRDRPVPDAKVAAAREGKRAVLEII